MIRHILWLSCVISSAAPYCQTAEARDPTADIPTGNLGVRLTRITENLGETANFGGGSVNQIAPIDYSVLPDGSGRALVATLGGVVRLVEKDGTLHGAALNTTVDPIAQSIVSPVGEWGFHSVAVHPGYSDPSSPGFQKFYTLNSRPDQPAASVTFDDGVGPTAVSHNDVLIEWTVSQLNSNNFSASSRKVLDVSQPGNSHNVVDLAFDKNGLLYIASGDGGTNNNVNGTQGRTTAPQDPRNVYGAILRIDPTNPSGPNVDLAGKFISANGAYSIPNTNFFAADGNAATLPEIAMVGLRSPWRINFDEATDKLYVGNVGNSTRESIIVLENGDNAGWGRIEGSLLASASIALEPSTALRTPLFEYDHDDGDSIVGGFVYRGTAIPSLVGKYVFGDLGQSTPNNPSGAGQLFYGIIDPADPDGNVGDIFRFQIDALGEQLPLRIMSIGQDADGELLVLGGTDPRTNGSGTFELEGVILKITAIPEPSAIITVIVGVSCAAWYRRRSRTSRSQIIKGSSSQ